MWILIGLIILLQATTAHAFEIEADKSAVRILAYEAITNQAEFEDAVSPEQFKAHLEILDKEGYNVLALKDVLSAYKKGAALPPKSVMLTFDGSHKSLVNFIAPTLKSYQFPYTVFISDSQIKSRDNTYLSKKDLKILKKQQLAEFGVHPFNDEKEIKDIRKVLNNAMAFYKKHFKTKPTYLSFTDGYYSQLYLESLKNYTFSVIMNADNSVHYNHSNKYFSRIALNKNNSDALQFERLLQSFSMPIKDITPTTSVVSTNNPAIGFTVTENLNLDKLTCHVVGQPAPVVELLGQRIEVRLHAPLTEELTQVKCTLPFLDTQNFNIEKWRVFGITLRHED